MYFPEYLYLSRLFVSTAVIYIALYKYLSKHQGNFGEFGELTMLANISSSTNIRCSSQAARNWQIYPHVK